MRAVLVATLVAAVLTVAVVAESADEDTSLEIPAFAKWRRFGRYRVASCLGKLRAAQAAQRTTLKDAETANIGISQALHHIQRLSQVQDVQELQEHSQKLDQLLTELEVPSGRSRSSVVNILARLKRSINRHKAHDSKQYNTLKSQCLHLCAVRKHSIKVFARRVYRWRSVLRKQYKMALASKTTSAYRKFKLRRLVRIANAKTQKARRAYTSTTRRCSVSHSYVRKSTSDSHRAKKSMKTNRAQKAMKKVMKRLFWSHTKHSRSLHHIRKTRHGKYAYTVVSHLKQSGLRVRFNKNTHVLHAIRVNPGAFPPKFSWKVTVSHGPVLSGSHPIVHHVLHKLVIKARKMNAVGAMAPTPVQKMRCFYIHKFIVWLRNYPRVIRMLRSWYFLSRRKAWSKYLKRGSMHVYKRKRAHLRAIYLHHLHKLSTVKVVVRRMMKKLILRNKIETIRAAIKASKAKKAPVKKISKPKSSAKSYPPMACPKGYSRNKDGVCKKGKSSAPSPQECGLNMVMVSGVCQCRRGFHSVGSNRCARNDARRHHLSRVCKKGFFYHRHRCVRRCPSPYKADDATRRCLNPNRKHTVTCGKNMKKSGGRCRCRAGYRRARGGAFCIKYKKNFHSCRKGWLLAGAKCVKKCPGHLLPDPKNRVCSVEGDIDARRAAAAAAAAKAAAAAARARAKARAVLRAKIRNLAQKHKNALARARAHAKKLHGARALAARLAALKARAQALLAAHKKAVGAARGRVARLAAAKAKLIAALKKVCAAHKRAMGSLKKLLAKSKRLADMASARDRALARARAAAKALAARHRAALLAAKKHAAALAAQRRILADREMSEERAKARAKARGLARRRAAMLAKARARARALEAKMRAAKAKAKRLAAARAAAANEALRLAKHRADQIARAKARAAALKKRAVAALTKCKKHRAALRKARRDAAKAAARRKAALAAAKAREHAHKAALARAKAAAKRRAEALMRARKRYLKAVKARSKCAKIKCGCPSKKVNKNCETFKKAVSKAVNRKVGRALRTLKKSSSKTSSKTSTSTKKTSTKTLPGVAKRIVKKVAKKKFSSIKKFIWRLRKRTTQRLAALKSKMRRLSQVAKKSHSKKTVKMVKTVARKIVRRIVLVKKAAVRLVSKVIKKTSKKTSRKILAFVSRHSKLKKMEKTKKGSWWARYKALKALRRRR